MWSYLLSFYTIYYDPSHATFVALTGHDKFVSDRITRKRELRSSSLRVLLIRFIENLDFQKSIFLKSLLEWNYTHGSISIKIHIVFTNLLLSNNKMRRASRRFDFVEVYRGHSAMVPTCSRGTLTNVLPHRNAMPQTQDTTPHPVTVYRHGADLSLSYPLMRNVTLEYTTTHFNVYGQTRSGNPCPTFHTHQWTLKFMMLLWW